MLTLVDLGAKKGGSLDQVRKMQKQVFGGPADLSSAKCLGVDRQGDYGAYLTQKGYSFLKADVLDPKFIWPQAEYYTAWDFLEHLPSIEASDYVLGKMLESATRGVWLRMPCFEPDQLERLARAGLRLTWTTWSCHRSPYTTAHADQVVARSHGWRALKQKWVNAIHASDHKHLVPLGASRDAVEYQLEMGPKPHERFVPPIPSAIDYVACKVRVPVKIESGEETYSKLVAQIQAGKPVTFGRFGDGEWHAMLAYDPEWSGRFTPNKRVSCGLHGTNPEMAEALRAVLLGNPLYTFGMQPMVFRVMGDAVSEWLSRHGISREPWPNGDAIHDASRSGELGRLVAALRGKRVIMVGPEHLSGVTQMLGAEQRIDVPAQDAWYALGGITAACERVLADSPPAIVLFSAGPAAKVVIDRLYRKYGDRHSLIDAGAVWDVFAGIQSRKYHASVNLEQLAR